MKAAFMYPKPYNSIHPNKCPDLTVLSIYRCLLTSPGLYLSSN